MPLGAQPQILHSLDPARAEVDQARSEIRPVLLVHCRGALLSPTCHKPMQLDREHKRSEWSTAGTLRDQLALLGHEPLVKAHRLMVVHLKRTNILWPISGEGMRPGCRKILLVEIVLPTSRVVVVLLPPTRQRLRLMVVHLKRINILRPISG